MGIMNRATDHDTIATNHDPIATNHWGYINIWKLFVRQDLCQYVMITILKYFLRTDIVYKGYWQLNIIGLLNWYWWILARVGCENALACASKCAILTIALLPSSICYWLHKYFCGKINLHELWVKFFSNANVDWWYCILRQRCYRLLKIFLWKGMKNTH